MARFILSEEVYGNLLPYIKDDKITDINWNGSQLWINHQEKGRYMAKDFTMSESEIVQFTNSLANSVNESFNSHNPILEAETPELRISIVHESVAETGRSISIRKTPAVQRITFKSTQDTGYCPENIIKFLGTCVKAHLNIVVVGLPGVGKTELVKFLLSYIPPQERVITIEDNLELRYHSLFPEKDCVELKVTDEFDYPTAIKTCLRQLPIWIVLSEARSVEVKYLLESMSTGTHCMTTLHTDDARKIPDRIKNIMPEGGTARVENDIYSFLDVGILVRSYSEPGKAVQRKIAQVVLFDRDEESGENTITEIYDINKGIVKPTIPKNIARKFQELQNKL